MIQNNISDSQKPPSQRLKRLGWVLSSLVTLALVVWTVGWITLTGVNAQSQFSKISQSLGDYKTRIANDIIVVMKEQADLTPARDLKTKDEKGTFVYEALTKTALQTQQDLLALLDGKFKYKSFYVSNMVSIRAATPELIDLLAARNDVARIIPNPVVRVLGQPLIIQEEAPKAVGDNVMFVKANQVWETFKATGQGIVVSGQDTGIEWDHPALIKKYRGYNGGAVQHDYNWHDAIHAGSSTGNICGYDSKEPCDDNAHGTHTIGTVVGDDGMGRQIGVAPGSQFVGCRNMDAGNGRPETYIECFEWFLAPYPYGGNPKTDGDPKKSPHVMNNSWGCPPSEGCDGTEMIPVLQSLQMAGIMVVASAGNEGPACSTIDDQPAMHSATTFSVGAYDHRKSVIAGFSSRGPSKFDGMIGPDVVAPGVSILSAIPGKAYSGAGWSGTSMAGPHVVGAVALLWSAVPSLIGDIAGTIDIFEKSATPMKSTQTCGGVSGTLVPNNTFGYGVIDVFAAVKKAKGL